MRALFLLLLSAPALAAVPPEVLLLVDASRTMGQLPGGGEAVCAPADRRVPGAAAYVPDTAINLVKEALIGTRLGAPRWCISQGAADRALHVLGADGALPHHRPMCCADAACQAWAPCGNDHGQGAAADDAAPAGAFAPDGLLFADPGLRFALLTTDGHPGAAADATGHFSFGNDGLLVDGQPVDLGARGPGDHAGALVAGTGDAPPDIAQAQARVAQALGRVVPHSGAPLAALLRDLGVHLAARRGDDPAARCRRRVAVLITRGEETAFFDGRPPHFPGRPLEAEAADLLATGLALHVVVLSPPATPAVERMQRLARNVEGIQVHLAADLPSLRAALEAVLRDARTGRVGRITPRVVTPTAADQCPEGGAFPCVRPPESVVQWRLHAFSDVEPGGTYGRVHAEGLSCARTDAGDVPIVPRFEATLRYEEALAAWTRRAFALPAHLVLGPAAALFDELGRSRAPAVIQALTGLDDRPQPERPDGLPVGVPEGQRAAGLRLLGYFGDRGLTEGRRQLGAVEVGEIAVLSSPSLGLSAASAQAYEATHARRPTLVAVGAADGGVHVFRARDGVEVQTFVPSATWRRLPGEAAMDGPLVAADVLACRSEGAGNADCPSDPGSWRFSAWLFGGTGRGGDGLFGVPLSTALARDVQRPLAAADAAGLWEVPLGGSLATARPVPVMVREGEHLRAALVVGCGDDPDPVRRQRPDPAAPGRCVLVVEATTGRILRRFTDPTADRPFTGGALAYPAGVADRAWLGDAAGRLWRLDLRAADPARWGLTQVWPAAPEDLGSIEEKPGFALQPDGALSLVFALGMGPQGHGEVVSVTERTEVDAAGVQRWILTPAWRLPLGPDEVPTGAPVLRDGTAFFTTRQVRAAVGACPEVRGRLYGVHAWRTRGLMDLPAFSAEGARRLEVVPALPRFGGGAALSIVLPPGRTAHGLAFGRLPACVPGEAATTEVVLDLADERDGTSGLGAALPEGGLEVVEGDQLRALPLVGEFAIRTHGVELALCLDCDPQAGVMRRGGQPEPFPGRVYYWGDIFQQ